MSEEKAQCPCGRIIEKPGEYVVLFLKKELNEVDILCPNDTCYLRELGYVRFERHNEEVKFKEASFYPPYVTWNAGRLGSESGESILRSHLKGIVTKVIDWDMIKKGARAT